MRLLPPSSTSHADSTSCIFLQAHLHREAAQLLLKLAQTEAAGHAPPLRLKKLYVLAALEVDQLKARMLHIGDQGTAGSPARGPQQSSETGTAAQTLAGVDSQLVAFHPMLLCHASNSCICLHKDEAHSSHAYVAGFKLRSIVVVIIRRVVPPVFAFRM